MAAASAGPSYQVGPSEGLGSLLLSSSVVVVVAVVPCAEQHSPQHSLAPRPAVAPWAAVAAVAYLDRAYTAATVVVVVVALERSRHDDVAD